jgi:hypothetical protein
MSLSVIEEVLSYLGHEDGHWVVYCLLVEIGVAGLCVGRGAAPFVGVLLDVSRRSVRGVRVGRGLYQSKEVNRLCWIATS